MIGVKAIDHYPVTKMRFHHMTAVGVSALYQGVAQVKFRFDADFRHTRWSIIAMWMKSNLRGHFDPDGFDTTEFNEQTGYLEIYRFITFDDYDDAIMVYLKYA